MLDFIEYLHISDSKLIIALINVAVFVIIALLVNLFISKVLKKLVTFTKSDLDDKIIAILHKPIFLTIVLMGINTVIDYLSMDTLFEFYTHNILYSAIVLIWMASFMRITSAVVSNSLQRSSFAKGLSREIMPLLGNTAKILFFIGSLMGILGIWKVDITPLLASAGIVGVGVAVAAKDTLANFFGGISIFFDKPYKIGDYIELDQKERGEVVGIGVRSTWIKTRDDIQISIPNSIIANSKIVNESAPIPCFRVRVPLQIGYGADIELVQKELITIAQNTNGILADPEPRVRFREYGDSAMKFELLCWAEDPSQRGLNIHDINSAIYHKFNELGILFPHNQLDVHFPKKYNIDEEANKAE